MVRLLPLFLWVLCHYNLALGSDSAPTPARAERVNSLLQEAEARNLHESVQWRNLVHYKRTILGRMVSEADGRNFFVSAHGKTRPKDELRATLAGFFSGEKREMGESFPAQSVRCQFPARWKWLSSELGIGDDELPDTECGEFKKFHERSQARSVTLVFSSYNVGNPSSTFGHSLLRLNKREHGEKGSSPLLDLGINFAANPTTTNPVLYALFGMIGVFPGTFAALPYYYKVREYSDFDVRDLWEYGLNLSPEEIEMLIAHLWELGFTYFDYYFFTENCSYHILTALDVAAPRLNLASKLPAWVIPVDTIKTVWDTPGLIHDVTYRPSLRKQFLARFGELESEEERLAYGALISSDFNSSAISESLSAEAKARVLDAGIDQFDMRYFSKLVYEDKETKDKKNSLLIQRSRLPLASEMDIDPHPRERPHIAHDSARFGYTQIFSSEHGDGFEISQRFALHDLADPVDGYPPTARIEFFKFNLGGSWERDEFYVRSLDFMTVQTVQPWSEFEKPPSWLGRIGADRIEDSRCDGCLAGTVQAAAGLTLSMPFAPRTFLYFMGLGTLRTSPKFQSDKFTIEGGPLLGFRSILSDRLIFSLESTWQWALGPMDDLNHSAWARLRWVPDLKWGFELGARNEYSEEQLLTSIYYYF